MGRGKQRRKRYPQSRDGLQISETVIERNVQSLLQRHTPVDSSYGNIIKQFEDLAALFGWGNDDGSIYPVSLETLKKYIGLQQARVEPQSLISYLSAMREKHVSLGHADWEQTRFHQEVMLMLKNIKRKHCHKRPNQKPHITKEGLKRIKSALDLEDGEQLLVWTIATVAFHSLARLGELVVTNASGSERTVRLEHLAFHSAGDIPFATITIPHSKVHDPSLPAELIIRYTGTDTCPLSALLNFVARRMSGGYGQGSTALFALSDGSVASRRWFIPLIQACLPENGVSGHSFRPEE
jgi:hypothetical protein